MSSPTRRPMAMTVGLFLLAPFVGELLLGNVPVSQAASILLLAPLYGGGALLVREVARRHGLGWPGIALLAAAYALVEEAPVDQMVFNPGYLGLDSFAGMDEIPGLGISGSLVLFSLALHTVWSICVPIAVVETFDPTPTEPWLGRRGLLVVASVFLVACVGLGWLQAVDLSFVGTPAQFAVSGLAIVALVVAAFLVGRRRVGAPLDRRAPRPWVAGLAALALTSGYWVLGDLPFADPWGAVASVVVFALAFAVGAVVVTRWSRRAGWDGRHRLALAAGAAATYATWFGPVQALEAGTSPVEILVGTPLVALVMLVVVVAAARAQRRLRTSLPLPA